MCGGDERQTWSWVTDSFRVKVLIQSFGKWSSQVALVAHYLEEHRIPATAATGWRANFVLNFSSKLFDIYIEWRRPLFDLSVDICRHFNRKKWRPLLLAVHVIKKYESFSSWKILGSAARDFFSYSTTCVKCGRHVLAYSHSLFISSTFYSCKAS